MSANSTVTSRSRPSSRVGSRSSAAARSGVKNCSNWTRRRAAWASLSSRASPAATAAARTWVNWASSGLISGERPAPRRAP